jgi:cytochrome c peroxidase
METLKSMPEYVSAFPEAKEPMTYDHFGQAVGAFERQLATPGRFDQFLGGQEAALTQEERAGLDAFMEAGCTACHSGALLGGHMYQKLGLVKPWPNQKDQGRFEVTKAESDRMMFKVPSLRNIAETGPYFHDGQTKSLEEAVTLMARHQLGRELKGAQVKSIVTFLKALTAQPKAELLAVPSLPKSTDKTPKPNPN